MLKAIKKRRAYEDIVMQIRNLIKKGKLKQGDVLPNERELSDTFKVSRYTVREAIRTLEFMKLVESRQGTGTYVLASSEEAIIQPLAASIFHEKDSIKDVFRIRKIIEPHVTQLAAENATDKEIRELEEIIKEQEKALPDESAGSDCEFHNQLVKMAKDRVLGRLLLTVFDLLNESKENCYHGADRVQKSISGHRQIIKAIKSKNGVSARRSMRRHLEELEDIFFAGMKGGDKRTSQKGG